METLGLKPDSKCDCALEHDIDKNCQVTLSWNTNRVKPTRKKCAEPCLDIAHFASHRSTKQFKALSQAKRENRSVLIGDQKRQASMKIRNKHQSPAKPILADLIHARLDQVEGPQWTIITMSRTESRLDKITFCLRQVAELINICLVFEMEQNHQKETRGEQSMYPLSVERQGL